MNNMCYLIPSLSLSLTHTHTHTHTPLPQSLTLFGFPFTMQFFKILPFLALLLTPICWASGLTVTAEDGHGQEDDEHLSSFPTHRHLIQGRCNIPLLFVFGASMVDTGQYAATLPYSTAADFPPYGIDYFSRPAGRWSNGPSSWTSSVSLITTTFNPNFPFLSNPRARNFVTSD